MGTVSALRLPEDKQVLVHGRLIVCAACSAVAHQHWQLLPATVDPDRTGVHLGLSAGSVSDVKDVEAGA